MQLTKAQERDLLKAYQRYSNGWGDGGLRTGKYLAKKGLVKKTRYFPYPSSWTFYEITEEGIAVAKSLGGLT